MKDTPVTIRDGQIFWRGTFKTRAEAERLAEQFDQVLAGDWFALLSLKYAADLRAALKQTEMADVA